VKYADQRRRHKNTYLILVQENVSLIQIQTMTFSIKQGVKNKMSDSEMQYCAIIIAGGQN